MKRFDDKVVLIVGATSGIGKAAAIAFAAEGASIVFSGRRKAEGEQLVHDIAASGGTATFIRGDASIAQNVEHLVSETMAKYGRLDCAFNNLGIGGKPGLLTEIKEEEWDCVLNTNLKSIWLCMKYQIPAMLAGGGGCIVNNASIYGLNATNLGVAAYTSSKHGVIGLTKSAALEFADKGIRVNAVCPSWIPTEGNEEALSDQQLFTAVKESHPMKRLGKLEEITEAVLWLCSGRCDFMTAHSLVIDGGKLGLC